MIGRCRRVTELRNNCRSSEMSECHIEPPMVIDNIELKV
jgi:hypothetical protein